MPALESFFEEDYFSCRERFRTSANQSGWALTRYSYLADGFDDLSIDVAIREPERLKRDNSIRTPVLVVSSGLHGVEGYLGSAMQTALLERHWPLVDELKVVLTHAVSPYAFACDRRADEANIDLNRNFLLKGESYCGAHPTYVELNGFLNPVSPASPLDLYYIKAMGLLMQHGMPALRGAIAEGQYQFPQGLFYGGAGPAQSQLKLQDVLSSIIQPHDMVMHLDVHTGLGRWGTCKLLWDYQPDRQVRDELIRSFPEGSCSFQNDDAETYNAKGSLGQWCREQRFCDTLHGIRNYDAVCMEFGTYSGLHMLRVLREENRNFHHGKRSSRLEGSRNRIRQAFCPHQTSWRREVMATAGEHLKCTQDFLLRRIASA